MSREKFNLHAAVYLVLQKDNKILLLRRFNTGWQDGKYTLIAGHVDGNETIADCMAREAREEAAIIISSNSLKVVHTVHHMEDNGDEYVDFYLSADKWKGEPQNVEPNKCDDMQWFAVNDLPEDLLTNVKSALSYINEGETFSEFKWD